MRKNFKAAHARHPDVENREVERFFLNCFQRVCAVIKAGDVVIGALQELRDRKTQRIVIVRDNDAHWFVRIRAHRRGLLQNGGCR